MANQRPVLQSTESRSPASADCKPDFGRSRREDIDIVNWLCRNCNGTVGSESTLDEDQYDFPNNNCVSDEHHRVYLRPGPFTLGAAKPAIRYSIYLDYLLP